MFTLGLLFVAFVTFETMFNGLEEKFCISQILNGHKDGRVHTAARAISRS